MMVERNETHSGEGKVLMVVGADQDTLEDMQSRLPGYQCVGREVEEVRQSPEEAGAEQADAVLVWAGKHNENEAEKTCEALREKDALSGTPVLAAITMFQIVVGNQVKKIPGAHYVFTPVQEEDLDERLEVVREELT